MPGIAETVNFGHINRSYHGILGVNATGIIHKGARIDFTAPHDRVF
jgi:putative glutathione S-transferase